MLPCLPLAVAGSGIMWLLGAVFCLLMVYAGLLNKLYGSLVTLFLTAFGVLVALSFFEPVAVMLMNVASWTHRFAYGVVMMLLFLATYVVGYALAMANLPGKLDLNKYVDTIGGAVMGLLTGVLFSGFMMLALYLFPLAGYQNQKGTFMDTDVTVVRLAGLVHERIPWKKFDTSEFLHWVKTVNQPARRSKPVQQETDRWRRPPPR